MQLLRQLAGRLRLRGRVAIAPDALGVSKFHQVDGRVYRGAQPADYGFQSLARLGIRTVVCLRRESGRMEAERELVRAAGMRFVSIPMDDLAAPADRQIAEALAVLGDDSAVPVFVHCRKGVDRTGTVIACYRIAHDHWPSRVALDEARSLGMSVLERGMRRYILAFQAPPETVSAAPR